ncbi:MAG: hypothetical protein KA715_09240 [Xanthomonadaceae bacterium]|nr:hypothetical protein [Xanthomonadaceae bacterium]
MRKHNAFLSHQLVRFGIMTLDQVIDSCAGRCTRATVYRMLKELRTTAFVDKPYFPSAPFNIFAATKKLRNQVLSTSHIGNSGIHHRNAAHAIAVTETFLVLSRYSFITLIATEHEIGSFEIKQFCHEKIPDGLIQISNSDGKFELAVEVESTQKNDYLMDELIEKYRATFLKEMICAGLLVVVRNKTILTAYQEKIGKLPPEFEKRILIVTFEGLKSLDSRYFGIQHKYPGESLDKIATISQGVVNAVPLFYKDFCSLSSPLSPPHSEVDSIDTHKGLL